MTTRNFARLWLRKHYSCFSREKFRASKFYDGNLWFFTFPCDFFNRQGHLNMLLQKQDDLMDFYFLRIPFNYFADNQNNLDIRNNGKFDLHLSAAKNRWLVDMRGSGVEFAQFLMGEIK